MLTSEQQTHKPKQSKIRYTEYYDLQSTFDRLYADSLKGKTFHNLIGLMASEENIKLAYLKTVKGLGRNYSWKERFGEEKPC